MQKSELLSLLLDHQTFFQKPPDQVPRRIDYTPYLKDGEIVFISGPLHSGKTSFLGQVASSLQGARIYIDFEDSRLQELEPENFPDVLETAAEICKNELEKSESEQVYYFLDEVHKVPDWENWVDRLHGEGAKIFVTFSNSSLMKPEVLSRFSGRSKVLKLFPFSFKEYLHLKGIRISQPDLLTASRCDEMLCMFLSYFDNGGFPAVVKDNDARLSRKFFEETLQKEVVARYEVQDARCLKNLAVFLISNMASEYSLDTLKKVSEIENEGTVRRYMDYLEEVFLLYRVPMFNYSGAGNEQDIPYNIPCKVYAGDTGFFKTVSPNYPDSLGLRFENLVFLELLKKGKEVFYFKNNKECDFVVKGEEGPEIEAAIQVSTSLGNPVVREREILGLLGAMEEYGLKEGLILTLDDEEVLEVEDAGGEKRKISVRPAWKWMLG